MKKFDGYMLISDMDATLLNSKSLVSEKNKEAIEYFKENGGLFTVASGRTYSAVRSYLWQVKINAPAILDNGARIYDFSKEEYIFNQSLEEERKEFIKRFHSDYPGAGIEVYSNDIIYIYSKNFMSDRFAEKDYEYHFGIPDEVWNNPWSKMLLVGEKTELDRYSKIYSENYDKGYAVRSGDNFFDIVSNGVSKGNAAFMLAGFLNIDPDKVITVGDNMNDLSMIKDMKLSFAVDNAEAVIKQNAKFSAPSNNDDAIAYVINKIETKL